MAAIDRRGIIVDATDTAIAGDPNPGLAIKAPVRVATTAAITLSGLQTIDGIALADGDRVLVKDQADQRTNGLYNAATGLWQRTIDATSNDQWANGVLVLAAEGATNADAIFVCTAADPVELGTTALTFARSPLFSADLVAIAALADTGFAARTGVGAWALRNVAAGDGIAITNPAGTAGDPIIALTGDSVNGLTRVRVVAVANIDVASALIAGAVLDGVTLAAGDAVLLAGQSAPAQNGIYLTAAAGAAARSTTFSAYDSMPGRFCSVMEGATYGDTLWQCTSNKGGTLGTTALVFTEFSSGRELLTAARTYYVRSDGSDSNSGLVDSSGGAFLTIQKAIDTIIANLDTAGHTVTIQVGDGTYTGNVSFSKEWVGAGPIILTGANTTGAILSPASGLTVAFSGIIPSSVTLQKIKLVNNNSSVCISHSAVGQVILGASVEFGVATGGYHIRLLTPGSFLLAASGYTISGGAFTHMYVGVGGAYMQVEGSTVTLTGTPAFSGQFLWMPAGGNARITTTFSGSATGARYSLANNAVATGNSVGTTYLPGNAAGSATTGAQYAL